MRIRLSRHLSYCFGVQNTLTLVEDLLRKNPDRAYTMLGHIVHNEHVIRGLQDKGLRIALDADEIEDGATVIIPSHGAPQAVFDRLAERRVTVVDATCPMVKVIHRRAQKLEAEGFQPVIIGDPKHDEVKGIAGHVGRAIIVRSPEDVTPGEVRRHPQGRRRRPVHVHPRGGRGRPRRHPPHRSGGQVRGHHLPPDDRAAGGGPR